MNNFVCSYCEFERSLYGRVHQQLQVFNLIGETGRTDRNRVLSRRNLIKLKLPTLPTE